jgi:hypothetical protein
MRHLVKIAALAAIVLAGAPTWVGPAAAQELRLRIGPDGPRARIIERRDYRPRRTVCRTEWRTTVRPSGRVVRRPVEVCRTVRGRRW